MIEFDPESTKTANLEQLFEDLVKIKIKLEEGLRGIDEVYIETIKKLDNDFTALGILEDEYGYEVENVTFNENGSIYRIRNNSNQIIKIINNIVYDQVVEEAYVFQLKSIAEIDRKKDLIKFEINESHKIDVYSCKSVIRRAFQLDELINYCKDIAYYLTYFLNEKNPFIGDEKIEQKDIKKKETLLNLCLPKNVLWEKVTLKIKDGLKDIEIFYDNKFIKTASYTEIGFSSGKKESKENRQWELLKILSILLNTEKIQATPDNISAMLTKLVKKTVTIENVHQIKKSLSNSLQALFNIKEDPFFDYKQKGHYELKLKLLPQPELRNQGEIWLTASGYNDEIGVIFDQDEEINEEGY